MYQQYKEGWLEVISGCMFAGKTEELIRRIKVLEYAKRKSPYLNRKSTIATVKNVLYRIAEARQKLCDKPCA